MRCHYPRPLWHYDLFAAGAVLGLLLVLLLEALSSQVRVSVFRYKGSAPELVVTLDKQNGAAIQWVSGKPFRVWVSPSLPDGAEGQ